MQFLDHFLNPAGTQGLFIFKSLADPQAYGRGHLNRNNGS
jgi:hypothetical protein